MSRQQDRDHLVAQLGTTTHQTLLQFILGAGITVTAERWHENPHMDSPRDMDHWKVTLRAGRSRYTTYFSMGFGYHGTEPTAADVLDCLASDASSVDQNSFEDWCAEMGSDPDSRRAERTYKACAQSAKRLRQLLGDSAYETLVYHTERL
jgi:hypothetical protein